MESLISTFHVDINLFIAQVINFAIVFSVLYFFAFKPLFKVMGERSDKIAKGLKDAEEIKDRLALTNKEQEEIIVAAKKQASALLEEADKKGEQRKAELVARAKEEVGQVINNERAKLSQEKAETLKEIKKEVADLVILTVEKILEEKMTSAKDHELIKKLVK